MSFLFLFNLYLGNEGINLFGMTGIQQDSKKPGYMPQLDSLRAIAVILVIISHWFAKEHLFNRYTDNGILGVTLFFVLSGFLISSQIFYQIKQEQPISFKIFFIKRFFRIVPAFLVTVGLYFCFPFFRDFRGKCINIRRCLGGR